MRFQNSRRRIFGFRRNRCRRNQQPVLRGSINTTEQISAIHVDTLKNDAGPVERLSFMVNKQARNNPLTVRDLLQATRIAPCFIGVSGKSPKPKCAP